MKKSYLIDLLKKFDECGIKTEYNKPKDYDNYEKIKKDNMYFLVVYKWFNYGTGIFTEDYDNDMLTFFKLNEF